MAKLRANWQNLLGNHLAVHITRCSLLMGLVGVCFLLVQENYATDGVLVNVDRARAKEQRQVFGFCSAVRAIVHLSNFLCVK